LNCNIKQLQVFVYIYFTFDPTDTNKDGYIYLPQISPFNFFIKHYKRKL